MPGILLSSACRNFRRRSKATIIVFRAAAVFSFSFSAASAPYCAKVVTFDDIWLWSSEIAFAIGVGANVVPMRQPVIAYVLENPATVIVRASASLLRVATQVGFT